MYLPGWTPGGKGTALSPSKLVSLVEVLRTEGIERVRYALFDMTGWHRDYDPCLWRSRADEEQKRVGWEMWVRMEKIIATVLD